MMMPRIACLFTVAFACGFFTSLPAQNASSVIQRLEGASDAQLQQLLKRFPAADRDGDGTLTREEAVGYTKERFMKAAPSGGRAASKGAAPTFANVAYGLHERDVLDFWQAKGEGPRPLVVFIHGGGFTSGDKSKYHGTEEMKRLLNGGVSCAAINYPFRGDEPIQNILHHAARAVQFLRSKAGEWNLDKARVAGWGGSAGAGTSLWLATRDDLADPEAVDPVLRESSRLQAAVLQSTQATYDLTRWESFLGPADPSWWTSPDEAAEFYHFKVRADLEKPEALPVLRECDMLKWITSDDAPVFINNGQPDKPSRSRGHYLHHPAHAREIQKACDDAGVKCVWVQAVTDGEKPDPVEFVRASLRVAETLPAE